LLSLAGLVLPAIVLNQLYVIKPKLAERSLLTDKTLLKAIGPNGLPQKAGFLFNGEFKVGPHFSYFTRRPAWYATFGSSGQCFQLLVFHSMNPDFLKVLKRCAPEDWPIRYLVFLGKGDYTKDELFRALATRCSGTKKEFIYPGTDIPSVLILFDISPLHLVEARRPVLDPEVQTKQLAGDFDRWDIPSFDRRLKEITQAE